MQRTTSGQCGALRSGCREQSLELPPTASGHGLTAALNPSEFVTRTLLVGLFARRPRRDERQFIDHEPPLHRPQCRSSVARQLGKIFVE